MTKRMNSEVTSSDIIKFKLKDSTIKSCIDTACKLVDTMIDRNDLHGRDYLEKFLNILMGELAEQLVISWIKNCGKYVESAVDKNSGRPDLGHDILLKSKDGRQIKASIKSSLSVHKQPKDIISEFTLATTKKEIREVNIQVYFWLNLYDNPRKVLPSTDNLAIIAWCGKKDLQNFSSYTTEKRESPTQKLKNLRTMKTLLELIE